MAEKRDYYEVLGVDKGADDATLKRAYPVSYTHLDVYKRQGGELSRIMLAIKTLLADKDNTETLIFDEIDTGISGRTAQKVSEKMASIGKGHQVLCITHLAQIAAMADVHFEIAKQVEHMETCLLYTSRCV